MKDRIPKYPGRVKLTPVSGAANTYDMVRADEPEREGTPLNAETLLKEETAALYNLPVEEQFPDRAFEKIGNLLPQLITKTEIFTADSIFVVPKGVTVVRAMCYGAGGGGGDVAAGATAPCAGGGGGGYYAEESIDVTPGEAIYITIGKGGSHGESGGATSFGTYLSADGGEPGNGHKPGNGGSGGGYGEHYSNVKGGIGYQFGGGGGSYDDDYPSTSGGGEGGAMGGKGGSSIEDAADGIDTTGLAVPFPAPAPGGGKKGGGGGYGAAGGVSSASYSGAGGGGYGGAGGDVLSNDRGGAGGGGYGLSGKGANGASGTYRVAGPNSEWYIYGNDGGIGAGGSGAKSTESYAARGGNGGDGICTVTYSLKV